MSSVNTFILIDDKSKGIQMKVVFRRVIMSEVLTTFLPTALLIIISYSTTFFSDEFFEANLTVNLSVMFVMTTLFVSVMEKLPQTSYIRMVDVWLIYGQLFPFLEVVLVTYVEHFRGKKSNALGKTGVEMQTQTEKIFKVYLVFLFFC